MHIKTTKTFITPSFKVQLSGYSNRCIPFENIDTPLEVNIIIIGSVIFISIDTLYIPNKLKNSIVSVLNIEEKNIFICSTHTHFAPALDKTKPCLGEVDDKYLKFVLNKVVDNNCFYFFLRFKNDRMNFFIFFTIIVRSKIYLTFYG